MGSTVTAAITLDGNLADWTAADKQSDSATDRAASDTELLEWGVRAEGSTLFGFIRIDRSVADFYSGAGGRDIYASFWIDVDNAQGASEPATGIGTDQNFTSGLSHGVGYLGDGDEWGGGEFQSFDVYVELGLNNAGTPSAGNGLSGDGLNFWGDDANPLTSDNVNIRGSALSPSMWAVSGSDAIEFAVPLSAIIAEVSTYGDAVTPGLQWRIGARVDGHVSDDGLADYVGENSDTQVLLTVPEPAGLLRLTAAALLLIRRRRRCASCRAKSTSRWQCA